MYKIKKTLLFITLKVVLLFFFLISPPDDLFSFQKQPEFDRISSTWGLSHDVVTCFFQDSKGFIWIGTVDGLNKYDGYSFMVFKNLPDDSASISGNVITAIAEDKTGNIWVGTKNSGLNRYNRSNNLFTCFDRTFQGNYSNRYGSIISLAEENNNLWTCYENSIIKNLDLDTKKFTDFPIDSLSGIPSGSIKIEKCKLDRKNSCIWIGTRSHGLIKFNYNTKTVNIYDSKNDKRGMTSNFCISSLFLDKSGELWIGSDENGLFTYNEKNGRIEKYRISSLNENYFLKSRITAIFRDSYGFLWLGTGKNGLVRYDPKVKTHQLLKYDKLNDKSVSSNNIMSISEGPSGLIWIASDKGISNYDPVFNMMSMIETGYEDPMSLDNGFVNSIFEDETGYLWVGTNEKLKKYKYTAEKYISVPVNKNILSLFESFSVTVVHEYSGFLWIGTKKHGLVKYNLNTGNSNNYSFGSEGDQNSLLNCRITDLIPDESGNLLVSTWGNGLNSLNMENGEIKSYLPDFKKHNIKNCDKIYSLILDKDKNIWLGTHTGGLIRFNPGKGIYDSFLTDKANSGTIGSNTVYEIIEDKNGILWIGTASGGLHKFQPDKNTFIRFDAKSEIKNDNIFSLVEDDRGVIWFGTDKRAAGFDPESEKFLFLESTYWLNNNKFYNNALLKSNNGRLFWGGNKGINYFDPDIFLNMYKIPSVSFTAFSIMGEQADSVFLSDNPDKRSVKLPYYKNEFSFSFTIIDYRMAGSSKYLYQFEGKDKDWEYTPGLDYVYYDEIDPGEYNFKIKGANHMGVWDEAGDEIRIIITPPFWQTSWFKAILILCFTGLIITADKWRNKRIRLQKDRLEKIVKERTKDLRINQRELIKAKEDLETKVQKRTKELRFKNEELVGEIQVRKESELKRQNLEKQLFQSQKMESIGRLAGGIAHDFNNILTILMGYAELLKLKHNDIETSEAIAAEAIHTNTLRAKNLVSQLLGFAREGKYNPVPVDINAFLKNSMNILDKAFKKKIKTVFDLGIDLRYCIADKNQLDQVVSNLVLNSVDAMPGGGTITLKTENASVGENMDKQFSDLNPGSYVKVSISDTGIGIQENIVDKIFEPFYTTKGIGKGSGLGLATVYGIIKNHNGHIEVRSRPDEGAAFIFYLPATDKKEETEKKETAVQEGSETILLIDDEKYIRNVIKEQLKSLGYIVLTAGDGKEGVEVFCSVKEKIDIVLLDMIMPELSGKDTFYELINHKPDIPVLLISGFSLDKNAEEVLQDGAKGYLQKPATLTELSGAIKKILKSK